MRLMALGGVAVGAAISALLLGSTATAQSYRVGDRVEASPLMMNSKWESCTITALLPGGDVGVACGPRKTEYVVQGKWVRQAAAGGTVAPTSKQSGRVSATSAGACPNVQRGLVGHKREEHGICRIGATVTDRQGKTGTVLDAPDRTTCRVCLSDGTSRDYLTWMLSAGPAASQSKAAATTGKPSGNYQCYGGAAGNMKISINAGRWQGYYAETLPDGKVGISSRPNGSPYYMVCEKR